MKSEEKSEVGNRKKKVKSEVGKKSKVGSQIVSLLGFRRKEHWLRVFKVMNIFICESLQ